MLTLREYLQKFRKESAGVGSIKCYSHSINRLSTDFQQIGQHCPATNRKHEKKHSQYKEKSQGVYLD